MTPTTLRSLCSRLLRDERGSISIEFMLVAPLLLFLTTGGIAFWDAFHSSGQTSKIAYTVSDIMSRHDFVDDTDMAYIFGLENKMMAGDLDRRTLRITSVCFEDDKYQVLWSYTAGSDDLVKPEPMKDEQIPLDILPAMAPQDSVIITEISARWQPQFLNVGLTSRTWRSVLVNRPRFVKIIPHTALNPAKICPEDEDD